jgi:hypothetical protein
MAAEFKSYTQRRRPRLNSGIIVLRDKSKNYIFIDSDNAKETHFSLFDSSGSKLLRKGSIPVE